MATPIPVRFDLGKESWVEQGVLPVIPPPMEFDVLWDLHPKEYGQVMFNKRIINTPRWQQSYLKPYWYSGMMHEALPMPPPFAPFLEWANCMCTSMPYNSVLINWYMDGNHYIGKHSDSERQIVRHSPILSISLGQTRIFRIRSNEDGAPILKDIEMLNGSYLVMGGRMQEHFYHEVPKVTGHKGKNMGRRINITFRVMRDP
jgi:alkylated DNA repair dioxygenase AlkB